MSVTDSTHTSELAARAKEITERELVTYSERTQGSQKATERARKVLPAGVPSSFQAYDPHPIVVKHAAGAHMIDVDDNDAIRAPRCEIHLVDGLRGRPCRQWR